MFKSLAVCAFSVLIATVAAAQKPTTLAVADTLEIQRLYARYNHAVDSGDTKKFLDTFAPDAEFVIDGSRTMKGEKALAVLAPGPVKERAQARHMTTSVVLDPSPTGATGMAYVMLVNLQATPPVITGGGVYNDDLVKVAGQWRFKKRTFYSQTVPAPQKSSR